MPLVRGFDLQIPGVPGRTCRVRTGAGVLEALLEDLGDGAGDRGFAVLSDSRVAALYGEPLVARMRERGMRAEIVVFPEGEASKTRETKARVEDELARLGADRTWAVVAVGGGVTGDLGGFVAATWHRGVPIVQVPTTLLAMTDSALGGKTAVNLPSGKNLVGAFWQPQAIYADLATLATLPEREYRAGFAEAVKSAAVADAALFGRLEASVPALGRRDTAVLEDVVDACLRIKGRIVSEDERDTGRRAALNFGHTVGHALETVSAYALSHGEAVAIGIVVEARLAVERCGLDAEHARRMGGLLEAFGLPVRVPSGIDAARVVEVARADKKARGGAIRCALPARIGAMPPGADVTVGVEPGELRAALEAARC